MEEQRKKSCKLRQTISKFGHLLPLMAKKDDEEIPNEDELEKAINQMFKEQLLNEDRQQQILAMAPAMKWNLIKMHKKMMENVVQEIRSLNIKEIQDFLEGLKDKNLNPLEMQNLINNLKRWFLNASEFQVKSFCMYDGVKYLFKRLFEAEVRSRTTKSFRMEIEILKFLHVISKLERGVFDILLVKDTLYLLMNILHPFNPDITCLSLEILMTILWESSSSIDVLLNDMNRIKDEKGWQFRFYPLIKILENTNNIVIIKNVLRFINTLTSCDKKESKRLEIKAELINSGLKNTLEVK
jgi:hypothetical protein